MRRARLLSFYRYIRLRGARQDKSKVRPGKLCHADFSPRPPLRTSCPGAIYDVQPPCQPGAQVHAGTDEVVKAEDLAGVSEIALRVVSGLPDSR